MNQPAQTPAPAPPATSASPPASVLPQQPVAKPPQAEARSVEELLVQQGLIPAEQLQQLQLEASQSNRGVTELLTEKQLVSEEQLSKAQAQFYGVPFVSIAEIGVSPEALNTLPEGVARKYNMLPFAIDKQKNSLSVAMQNPLDLAALDFASQKTGFTILPHYGVPSQIAATLEERYAQNLSSEVTQALADTQQVEAKQLQKISSSNEVLRQAPVAKIVETVLSFAIKARASDVHIEPQEEKTRVRYRIDGILQEKLILPRGVHESVVSRIKILSDLKIDEKRVPQDGRFNFSAEGQSVDLRVSTLPTIHGEKIVMRLLKKDNKVPDLPALGFGGLALRHLEEAAKIPHGVVLITGPTGSGKTTTLYSLLHKINSPKVNIMTLEDPVEYQMKGVNQVQVNAQAGLTFASGLRSFLRQDPNIIMVGEIRDTETVELAIQASLTGHLVFSTLHTSSAAGAIPRLIDMKAEPFLLASSLTCLVAQRIVRRINERVREEYTPEPQVVEDIKKVLGPIYEQWCKKQGKDPNKLTLFRAKEQRSEKEAEYEGRIGIYEVMRIDDEIGKLILSSRPANEIEALAIRKGMLLMKQDGYLKALEGITTLEEVLRVAEV